MTSHQPARRGRRGLLTVVLLAVAGLAGWGLWTTLVARNKAIEYRLAKVERGNLTSTVSASGTLNAVTTVQVGSQISGQIKEVFVDFNSPVKQGQQLARIDPESFQHLGGLLHDRPVGPRPHEDCDFHPGDGNRIFAHYFPRTWP